MAPEYIRKAANRKDISVPKMSSQRATRAGTTLKMISMRTWRLRLTAIEAVKKMLQMTANDAISSAPTMETPNRLRPAISVTISMTERVRKIPPIMSSTLSHARPRRCRAANMKSPRVSVRLFELGLQFFNLGDTLLDAIGLRVIDGLHRGAPVSQLFLRQICNRHAIVCQQFLGRRDVFHCVIEI